MPTDRIGNLDTARVAKIMSAAIQEFSTESYEKASFNRIIKACGISKGTMYYYFKSKEDLYLTIIRACSREFTQLDLSSIVPTTSSGTYWSQIHTKLVALSRLFNRKSSVSRFIEQMLFLKNRDGDSPIKSIIATIDKVLENHIVAGQLAGAVRKDWSSKLIIAMLWTYWETIRTWQNVGDEESNKDQAELLLDILKRSLEPKKEQPMATPDISIP